MSKLVASFSVLAVLASFATVSTHGWADAPRETKPLFVLERNRNANYVRYDAQLAADGTLDPKEPVVAYWIMAAENGRREPLSAIERSLAYGFSTNADKRGNVWLSLVAHKAKPIRVFKDDSGVHAEIAIAGKRAYLTKLFVQAGPEFIPKVTFLDLYGNDVKTGEAVHERITPQ